MPHSVFLSGWFSGSGHNSPNSVSGAGGRGKQPKDLELFIFLILFFFFFSSYSIYCLYFKAWVMTVSASNC